uniref:Histone deacetylase 10 [Pelodiscus sinensis] n=1 Tax=Lepeophtheirus salmonis TaxID=72036 RepID=A0A0K2TQ87_LEPSM
MEKKFEDIISNLSSQLNSRNSNVSSYVCFCSDDEKLEPEFLNDSSGKFIWLNTQKALKEELEWLSMQGLNVTVSSSSLLAAGSIFQVIDAVHNNDAIAGISLIDHTRQTGISDLGPVYGKLKHRINRSMSVILNDGMITPKLNSFICENESILRFNILHSRDQDESNPFFDESEENINKHEVTIRLGNYCHPVDSDYLNLMYRILLPVGYEYSPEIIYVYASLGSGSLSAIGFSHLVHTLSTLANSKIVVIFEGSCNPFDNPRSLLRSVKTLLKDSLPNFEVYSPSDKNSSIIEKCRKALSVKWESLKDD